MTSTAETLARLAGRLVGQAERAADVAVPPEQRDAVRRVLALSLPGRLQVTWRVLRDTRTPDAARFLLFFSAAYALLPLRLSPARLGPLQRMEKLVLLPALIWATLRLLPPEVLDAATRADTEQEAGA